MMPEYSYACQYHCVVPTPKAQRLFRATKFRKTIFSESCQVYGWPRVGWCPRWLTFEHDVFAAILRLHSSCAACTCACMCDAHGWCGPRRGQTCPAGCTSPPEAATPGAINPCPIQQPIPSPCLPQQVCSSVRASMRSSMHSSVHTRMCACSAFSNSSASSDV